MVIGAGPAGVGAALSAAMIGVDTLIVDEAPTSGGQVYRAVPASLKLKSGASLGPDHAIGEEQRRQLMASPVRKAFGRRVWCVSPGLRVDTVGPAGLEHWQPKAIVVATGTSEQVVPFPGWTLPGVIGLGAATILLKSQHMLPGERTLVGGCGPLLAAVAFAILKGGGTVEAVVDLSGPRDWLGALPALCARPDLLRRGLAWMWSLRAAGVPMLFRHGIQEVRETSGILEIHVGPVDQARRPVAGGPTRHFHADAVTVGHGLVPATEITRLLRARHAFHAERGGWVAVRDADFRTSLERFYVAGDGAGISGAAAAFLQGRIAGLAAARDLGKIDDRTYQRVTAPFRAKLRKAEHFGHAMARLMALRPTQVEGVPDDTVVCRCEDVTRREIEVAVTRGAREVNQLKAWTRCGMGPCQGRMCGETAATLVAAHVGGREQAGIFTGRTPLRPISLAAMTGTYDYADIPTPKAAPL